MKRMLANLILFSSLFVFPWTLVFAATLFFSAVFAWYAEAIFIGLIAALIADMEWWKIFLIIGIPILFQEKLKSSINFDQFAAATIWLWFVGYTVAVAAFFVLI